METLSTPVILCSAAVAILLMTVITYQTLTLRAVRADVKLIRNLLTIWAEYWNTPASTIAHELRKVLPARR